MGEATVSGVAKKEGPCRGGPGKDLQGCERGVSQSPRHRYHARQRPRAVALPQTDGEEVKGE